MRPSPRLGARAMAAAALLAACSASTSGPPVLDFYGLPAGTQTYRMAVDVGGTVDVGGPQDAAALTRMIPNGDLRVRAAMRLDYEQSVRPQDEAGSDESGDLTLDATAKSMQGRIDSFLSTRTFGNEDLAAVGEGGRIRLEVAGDGSVAESSATPLGRFDLPVLRDVLTLWPCPELPADGAAPNAEWTSETPVGEGGTHMVSTNRYTPVDVEGARYLQLTAEGEAQVEVAGVDMDSILAVLTGEDGASGVGEVGLSARVRLDRSCRLDAEDRELDSWTLRGDVDIVMNAAGGGRFDSILDGTTMNFELVAESERTGT